MNREIREFGPPEEGDRGTWKIAIWKDLGTKRCVAQVEIPGMPRETYNNHALVARFNDVNPKFCDRVVRAIDQKPCHNGIPPETQILQRLAAV